MAHFTRCARAAGVSYFHFEAVGPTVPCFVSGRFDGAPMGRTVVFSGRLAGECGRAQCGSLIGHHCGKSTLNILDGLGEGSGLVVILDGAVSYGNVTFRKNTRVIKYW